MLARRLSLADWEESRPGVRLRWINSPDDPQLLALSKEQALDQEWCAQRLAVRDWCIVVEVGGTPAGMGLLSIQDFWVEEIGQQFRPGDAGCYFYATYVSPPFRGQRLQRLLDGQRLAKAANLGLQTAFALVEAKNAASLKSHGSSGFEQVARITRARWRSLELLDARPTSSRFSLGPTIPRLNLQFR